MKTKRIFRFVYLIIVGALLMFTPACSDDDEGGGLTNFEISDEYVSSFDVNEDPVYSSVPAGLAVKIYCIDDGTFNEMDIGSSGTFESLFTLTGLTISGGTIVSYEMPEEYDGDILYPFVLVILDATLNSTDIDGMTLDQILAITDEPGKLAIGYIYVETGEDPYTPISFTASVNGGTVVLELVDITVFETFLITM